MTETHTQTAADPGANEAAKPAVRKGGLGRGLSALIPQSGTQTPRAFGSAALNSGSASPPAPAHGHSAAHAHASAEAAPQVPPAKMEEGNLRNISLRSISLNPNQPRKEFGREELDDLTASIKEHGILQPIAVRVRPQEGEGSASVNEPPSYELIAGERRFRAASAAGLTEMPALVKEDISDRESLALAIIENIQREDLNIIETAQGYDELLHAYNMTQMELAQSIGKSQPQIANALRMLNLPALIQASLRGSEISEGHAKVILSLKAEPEQTTLWNEIVQQGLTVRQAEKRAAALRATAGSAPSPATPRTPAAAETHYAEVSQKISLNMGTKVRFVPGKGQRGVIEISYFDHDQLEDLIEKLNGGV